MTGQISHLYPHLASAPRPQGTSLLTLQDASGVCLTPHPRPPTRLASAWGQESALKALDLGPLSRWARSHPSTTPLIFPICQAPTDFQNHSSTEKTHGNANMDKDGAKAKNRKHKGKEKTFTVPSAACPAALPTHLVS